jgi:predicted kinase
VNLFERLCPAPPSWSVRWTDILAACAWLRDLEPDRTTHPARPAARRVAEALAGLPGWRGRPLPERVRLFAAALLAAGPVGPDGRSARREELAARRVLWEMSVPIAWREHVAALVRHRELPFGALVRRDLDRVAFRVSLLARNDDLALLATADALARDGGEALLDDVALFVEYTREIGCLDGPRAFASDHARFEYFRTAGRDPDYAAFDDTRLTVTVMSGLPGSGKDHWIAANRPGVSVISLDDLREELGVRPTEDQGPVIAAANARARVHLRAGTPYVWNATNVTRALRSRCIGLAAGYRARIEVVSVEAPPDVVHRRNSARARRVPAAVIDRMAGRWEPPDPTEAHEVRWVLND